MYLLTMFQYFFRWFSEIRTAFVQCLNGRLECFSYCGILNRRDIFIDFSRQLFCAPWFHEIFLQIFWLLFTFEFLTQNSHLSMDVKLASVWFNFLLVEGWVIKIDANLALIICKNSVWLVLRAGLLIFMGTLKSVCSSWFPLISRDKYQHTHLRVPMLQPNECTL